MKKKVIIPTIALVAILGAIALSPVPASAQDPTYSTLITKIAQRFGLPEADVQQVVKEVRAEHMSSLRTKWEDRLSQAVSDGKITEAQKQALIAKHTEIQEKLVALKDVPADERKAKMKEIFDDLQKWATDNNIDMKKFGALGMRHGFGMGFKMGYWAGDK